VRLEKGLRTEFSLVRSLKAGKSMPTVKKSVVAQNEKKNASVNLTLIGD
jgi:hypothetical protein